MYLELIVYAIILFAALRISVWLIKILPVRKAIKKRLLRVFPIIEFFLWIGFVIWVVSNLLQDTFIFKPIILSLLLIGILLLAWFVLKDFIAGLVLKTQIDIKIGDKIKIAESDGIITDIGYLALQIESESGEIELIPYSHVKSRKLIKPNPNTFFVKELIRLDVAKTMQINELTEKIRRIILNSPYSAVTKQPVFNKIDERNDDFHLEIYVFVLNKNHAKLLKEKVLTDLQV